MADATIKSNKLIGLKNLGATGYINCILHQLFHIKQFKYGIINAGIDISKNASDDELKDSLLYQTMQAFVFMSLSTTSTPFDMKSFCFAYKDESGKNPINVQTPADAQEFIRTFLNRLEEELKNTKYEHLIDETIRSGVVHVMKCERCNTDRSRRQEMPIISVPMHNCSNLNDSLKKCVENESLDGVSCHVCQARTTHLKGMMLSKLPNTIIFHVSRFQLNFETFRHEKVNTKWIIPDDINLKEYTKVDKDVNFGDKYFEYELVGVVIHYGTVETGELYSLIKSRNDTKGNVLLYGFIADNGYRDGLEKKSGVMKIILKYYCYRAWCYAFDDNSYVISEDEVKRQSNGGSARNGYMMVYERKEFVEIKDECVGEFKNVKEIEEC
eukprot:78565_1